MTPDAIANKSFFRSVTKLPGRSALAMRFVSDRDFEMLHSVLESTLSLTPLYVYNIEHNVNMPMFGDCMSARVLCARGMAGTRAVALAKQVRHALDGVPFEMLRLAPRERLDASLGLLAGPVARMLADSDLQPHTQHILDGGKESDLAHVQMTPLFAEFYGSILSKADKRGYRIDWLPPTDSNFPARFNEDSTQFRHVTAEYVNLTADLPHFPLRTT